MQVREIRAALREGRRIYSSAVVSHSPLWPAAFQNCGADFVFIDSEHTPVDRETLAWCCRAYQSIGVPPVVRISNPDPSEASRVLDGGACGIIAPYIESAEQVRALTAVARYRPLKGQRVADALRDPDGLEPKLRKYLDDRNADTLLIANIESVPAVDRLPEILSVGGLDAVLIGPHDLSCSLGIPEQYDHPRFDETVRTIFRVARQHNVGAGIHFWLSLDREIEWALTAGANLIMHSTDMTLYTDTLKRDLHYLRHKLGDSSSADDKSSEII